MADENRKNWRRRLRVPESAIKGEIITIKTMAEHIMEPGVRRDPDTGVIYPKKIIDHVYVRYNGKQVFKSQWYSGVSANPYISFNVRAERSGKIEIEWVDDYDPDMWSQFLTASLYVQAHQPPPRSNAVLFMYHPHGKPTGTVSWGSNSTSFGGSSTSLEDFYWIYYAPRTSSKGALAGRSLDGFVMAAWKGSLDKAFNGTIAADGTTTNGAETVIDDLTYMSGN